MKTLKPEEILFLIRKYVPYMSVKELEYILKRKRVIQVDHFHVLVHSFIKEILYDISLEQRYVCLKHCGDNIKDTEYTIYRDKTPPYTLTMQ